ncbi:MAG: hypothetical protein ACLS3M_13555, partial [Collinsella sp.]
AQQQAAEAARERAAQEFEQNEAMQSGPVDAAEATTSFESQQPTSADVVEATTSFEAQQHVDSTMSFDAAQFDSTITFEKQGTAIAEPLPVSDEQATRQTMTSPLMLPKSKMLPRTSPSRLTRRRAIRGSRSR